VTGQLEPFENRWKQPGNVTGRDEIEELRKTVILGTTHTRTHTSDSTNVKAENIQHGK
jgi:hypothetical protein